MLRRASIPVVRPLGVDVGSAVNLVGAVLKYLAAAFLLPAAVALGYDEPVWPFLAAAGITGAGGYALERATRSEQLVGVREGFLVVALTWVAVPAFGGLPYVLADEPQLARPVDAYFEAMSGFTATGATLLTDIEALDRSLLLWRQLTQWLGGMGIIVLAVAVLPRLRVGGRQLLQSELAGPTEVERLTATIRETARRLWVLYVGLTVAAIAVLTGYGWTGVDDEMDLYQATAHAFSTLAIGGFSTQEESMAAFGAVTQWTVVVLLVLAGINFLRLYLVLVRGRVRAVTHDDEFRLYLVFLAAGAVLLLSELEAGGLAGGEEAVRNAVFQAVSIMTTAGFATADYTQWSALAELTLLLLMFLGASAGSTGGSIKVIRHLLMFRIIRRELEQTVHREMIVPVRLNGAVVEDRALRGVVAFIVVYLGLFAFGALGLVVDAARAGTEVQSFEALGAAAACLGNVGPAFGFAGPFGSYEPFSDLSTGVLVALMWLGRLEIIPVAVLLTRNYWRA
ncbi:MAG TPA: TrkH family potassium uptake protein [Gaiellaceae bacterium]|nr:TrkH family potassium uptake protein [Gaiellaceae bacterium]